MASNITPKKSKTNLQLLTKIHNFTNKCLNFGIKLLTDPQQTWIITIVIVVIELILNLIIIQRVNYTEIDWKAYMQECEGFLNGTLDYSLLKGDTGPLVYPAGFVYFYSILYYVTSQGENIRLAQYIFLIIYLVQIYFVLNIYQKTCKVPPYALLITILTSYRVHSIYVLRLFNDTIAVLLFYVSLYLFLISKWTFGSIVYSLAVSIKMNILLYAPALFFTYISNFGIYGTIKYLVICALVQLILGAPFLYGNWMSYLKGSFDFQRVFEHKWTVNYRFLPTEIFESRYFHVSLLILHILLLSLFLYKLRKYFTSYPKLKELENQFVPQIAKKNKELKEKRKQKKVKHKQNIEENLSSEQEEFLKSFEISLAKQSGVVNKNISKKKTVEDDEPGHYSINFNRINQLFVLPFFITNFIGIVCARSLHYQFYVWYFHSLPYLLFFTNFKKRTIFLILALIEMCWNTYPSTIYSSLMLHCCHLLILYGIYNKI